MKKCRLSFLTFCLIKINILQDANWVIEDLACEMLQNHKTCNEKSLPQKVKVCDLL